MNDPIPLHVLVRILPGLQPNTPTKPGHVCLTYLFEIDGTVPNRDDGQPARYHLLVEEKLLPRQDVVRELVRMAAEQDLHDLLGERPHLPALGLPSAPGAARALEILLRFGESNGGTGHGRGDHEIVGEAIGVLEETLPADGSEVLSKRESGNISGPEYVWHLANGLSIAIQKTQVYSRPRAPHPTATENVLLCEVLRAPATYPPLAQVTLFDDGRLETMHTAKGVADMARVNDAVRALVREAGEIGREWW